jgi:hypothetical protein
LESRPIPAAQWWLVLTWPRVRPARKFLARWPSANSEFLHPNGLTVESVEKIFAEACAAYEEIRQTLG